jgi:hypothetical protein
VSTNRPRQRRTANRRPTAPAAGSRAPRPTAARRREPAPPADNGGIRGALERTSLSALAALTRLPRWLLGLAAAAALLGGMLTPSPWGPLLLGLVALFLIWLLVLAWPALDARARTSRVAVVALLVGVTFARAVNWA